MTGLIMQLTGIGSEQDSPNIGIEKQQPGMTARHGIRVPEVKRQAMHKEIEVKNRKSELSGIAAEYLKCRPVLNSPDMLHEIVESVAGSKDQTRK